MSQLQITYIPATKLHHLPDNARKLKDKQAIEKLRGLIRSHGFRNPLEIWKDESGRWIIIVGNHRFKAGKLEGMTEFPCIEYTGSREMMLARALSDNASNEWTTWNTNILQGQIYQLEGLDDISLSTGFDAWFLDSLKKLDEKGNTDPDSIPDTPQVPITKKGDVWQLGNHRLLCGDSTDPATIARLLDGAQPDLCLYDPPYDMPKAWSYSLLCPSIAVFHDYKSLVGAVSALHEKKHTYQFIWDCGACWWTPNRPLARHKSCIVGLDSAHWLVDKATFVDGKERKTKKVKNTRGYCDYEPLPDGRVRMSTVFMTPTAKEDGGHQHSKPVAWMQAIIAGTGAKTVVDQFAGSGTGIIASHRLGITCYSIELSEAQCDVIVKRWEEYTGGVAVLQK